MKRNIKIIIMNNNIPGTAIFFFVFVFCVTVINAQNTQNTFQDVTSILSSHIIEHISPYIGSDPNDNKTTDLFISVFNDRHQVSRLFLYNDDDIYQRQTQLRGEAFVILNNIIHGSNDFSDGQDVRNYQFNMMVSFMTLALLTPHSSTPLIDRAQSFVRHDTWYYYPAHYTTAVFLEVLIIIEQAAELSQRRRQNIDITDINERVIPKLQALSIYLSNAYESGENDLGEALIDYVLLINDIIRRLTQ